MTDISIRYNGTDITDLCLLEGTTFTAQSNGVAGTCQIGFKDVEQAYRFTLGKTLELYLDGVREWDGYLVRHSYNYWFDGHDANCYPCPHVTPRKLILHGVDRNILFTARVMYDKDAPTNVTQPVWPENTMDSAVIAASLTNYIDDLDGIDFVTKVETVASPDPFAEFQVPGPADMLDALFANLALSVGSVYYIDPDRALVYTDVNTPNAPFGISDKPTAGEVGCRELNILADASHMVNDALIWGAGQGSTSVEFGRVQDAASIAAHGRWQNSGGYRHNLWKQESIDRIANSIVYGSPANKRGHKDDAITVTCTVFEPGLRVGHKVNVRSAVFDFTDVIPIRGLTMTFPTPSRVQYDLKISHEIDKPWSISEFWWPPPETEQCIPVSCAVVTGPAGGSETHHTIEERVCLPIPTCGEICISPVLDHCGVGTRATDIEDMPSGCIDTFSRTVGDGLGVSELEGNKTFASTPNAFAVTSAGAWLRRLATSANGIARLTFPQTAPGCVSFDILWLKLGSDNFFGGISLILRNGAEHSNSPIYKAYSMRQNWTGDDSLIFQYAALGNQAFSDEGQSSLGVLKIDPSQGWYTWQLQYSYNELKLSWWPRGSPTQEQSVSLTQAPESFSDGWYLPSVDTLELRVAATVHANGYGEVGEIIALIDNLNVCCETYDVVGPYCQYSTTIPYTPGSARLYMDGILLVKGVDWDEINPAAGLIRVYIEVTGDLNLCFTGVGTSTVALPVLLPNTSTGTSGLFSLPVTGPVTGVFGPQDNSTWGGAVWHNIYYQHFHNGVDFGVATGTPVYAAAAGYVKHESQSAGGVMIHIYHDNGMRTTYAHLSQRLVADGSTVTRGQHIAYSGATGNVTGAHLHWGLVYNGWPEDPMRYT